MEDHKILQSHGIDANYGQPIAHRKLKNGMPSRISVIAQMFSYHVKNNT